MTFYWSWNIAVYLSDWGCCWLNDIYVPGDWSHRPYIVFSDVMFNCDQSRHVQFADSGKTLKHVKLVMTFDRCRSADIQWYRIQGLYRFTWHYKICWNVINASGLEREVIPHLCYTLREMEQQASSHIVLWQSKGDRSILTHKAYFGDFSSKQSPKWSALLQVLEMAVCEISRTR